MDAEMQAFIHSPINSDFGLSLDEVVSHCDNTTGSFGRFQAWCNGDTATIKSVLQAVQDVGMSPAFFASYEANEGYNSSWGWLNYTTPQGNPVQDASFVAKHMVAVSNTSTNQPSWIDAGNPVDFVPQADKDAGNADFASLALGTVGKSYIPSTAATTWEVYYPNGLLAQYNQIQDYGHPLTDAIRVIKSWGGTITGSSGTPAKPSKPAPNKPPTTSKPKPAVNTAPQTPIYLKNSNGFQLGGDNHSIRYGDFLFNKNKKASSKPTNNKKPAQDNHNQDVNQGNKDKPKPSNPNPNLDLAWLDSIHGQQVGGSDQCYGLASAWAQHNGTPQLIGGSRQPGIEVANPSLDVSMGACNIGCEYPWDSWGWDVIVHPTLDQIKAGDICCMVCDTAGWIPPYQGVAYGHVCIAGVNSGGIFSLWEQNGVSRQDGNFGVAKQPQDHGSPDFAKNYIQWCFYAIRKR